MNNVLVYCELSEKKTVAEVFPRKKLLPPPTMRRTVSFPTGKAALPWQ